MKFVKNAIDIEKKASLEPQSILHKISQYCSYINQLVNSTIAKLLVFFS